MKGVGLGTPATRTRLLYRLRARALMEEVSLGPAQRSGSKRVCVTVDMADICLSALDPRGGCQPSCWDTEQQARPAGLRPQHTPLASPQP